MFIGIIAAAIARAPARFGQRNKSRNDARFQSARGPIMQQGRLHGTAVRVCIKTKVPMNFQ